MAAQKKLVFGFGGPSLLDRAKIASEPRTGRGKVYVCLDASKLGEFYRSLPFSLRGFEKSSFENQGLISVCYEDDPVVLVSIPQEGESGRDQGLLDGGAYSRARDAMGRVCLAMASQSYLEWDVVVEGKKEDWLGVMVGLGLSNYRFLNPQGQGFKVSFVGAKKADLERARCLAEGVNLARHLVNTPANLLNPKTYAEEVKRLFSEEPDVKVEVWSPTRLAKEKMNLLLAVGGAAEEGPRMVKLSYRPKGAKGQPVALVGKGITFDSGGLDLKPSAGMRLMKKDMGGSASVVGVFYDLVKRGLALKVDAYLALAENAVSSSAFRPGDVIQARNGQRVEIHNTDAEGRLVLADVLSVASGAKGAAKPRLIVNMATLTGAARVALGLKIGALFSNSSELASQLLKSGQERGDWFWQLPLFSGYEDQLKTSFADINHCGTSRFGGALTAALFLHNFVDKEVGFLHLDMMAWGDPSGPFVESGGNGQGVQGVARFLESLVAK